jgi:hypothetical protein
MYRVTLACACVTDEEGPAVAADIEREFSEHRPHHSNVACRFSGRDLILVAENDYDERGLALMDEFSDCISAYVREPLEGPVRILAIEEF